MSILLDALRKSERRERLGDVPDIHGASEPASRRSLAPWATPALAAVAVVLAVAVAGWFGWRAWSGATVPVAPPEFAPEAAGVAAPAGPAGLATGPVASPDLAGTGANESDPERGEKAPGVAASDSPAAPRLDRQPRSPVETLSGERPHRAADRANASPPGDRVAAEPDAAGAPDAETVAATATRDGKADAAGARDSAAGSKSAFAQDDVLEALTRAVETTGMEDAAAEDAATSAVRPARRPSPANDAGLISYWQLPENVRSGLPELRITVLAWDEDPEARFLIMGGRRFGEGDEVSGGLTLEEIRRDQVLFRHRAYRFYVKQ